MLMTTESPKQELPKATAPLKTVLLVDDWDDGRIMTKLFLSNFGYAVDCARSGEEALLLFDPHIHDAVLTDNNMSGMTGAEMAHIIKIRSPNTPVVMYSGAPPDARACLGLGILNQKAGRYAESVELLAEGLSYFPEDEQLQICLAVSQMNLGRFREALALLTHCTSQPDAKRLAAACRNAMGRS